VAVAIVDVGDGVVAIRRAIPPDVGKLALPGGFIALGESWQAAAARELREETGICVDESAIRDFLSRSAPDGTLLVFGSVVLSRALLPAYTLNDEVSEMVILRQPTELAFDLHTDALERYLRPG
jgi:ADP-ribose pyrophosphatase YjhB (NUDIX family)